MSTLDPLVLARTQFAANITFHILFPTITIALGWMLLFMRLRWIKTRDPAWLIAYRFWTKVFALSFALGVVSGITMSFQFGTNWPGFMQSVGNVAGPLLGYEVLTAFFLEATFLGVMLFGESRVSERTHLLATALVAFGTTMSAFWILALNSWMQTPAGFVMVEGKAHVTSWLEVIFNPSFPYRLTHMLLATLITVSFLLAGVSAWQRLRGRANASTDRVLRVGVTVAALLTPLQIFVGDQHGLNTLEHQPAKIATMEALWETRAGAPLVLFALPDTKEKTNRYAIEIPNGASLILKHDPHAEVQGIAAFGDDHPSVPALFWAFRIMVGVGVAMLLVSWWAAWTVWRKKTANRFLQWILVAMTFSGWVATVAGWYVAEIGRQPWIVYGVLRTADVASNVPAADIAATLVAYLITYLLLIIAYISVLRYLAKKPVDAAPSSLSQRSSAGAATLAKGA